MRSFSQCTSVYLGISTDEVLGRPEQDVVRERLLTGIDKVICPLLEQHRVREFRTGRTILLGRDKIRHHREAIPSGRISADDFEFARNVTEPAGDVVLTPYRNCPTAR
jgi:hypothetical protein